jgi:hypothetical protein
LAGTHTGHTDRANLTVRQDSIRLSAAGPSCVGCARHGHRGRAAAAGVSVDFRSRVRGSGPRAGLGLGAGLARLGSTQVPWNQRLTTMDNPQEAPTGQGSSTPGAGHTVVGAHTEAKQEQDPYRSDDSTTPHRNAPRANRNLRARGRALAIRAACSWRARPQPSGTELCPQHPCS